MKKFAALILAAALLLSCFPAAVAESPTEINVMIWYRDIDDLYFDEMPYYNDPDTGITAQSGVKANFNQVKGADWSTRLNLMFASAQYPEIIMRGDINLEMYGVDQEILIPLDSYIEQYMPNYKALLDADPALAQSLRSSDGQMYQIGWLIPQNINTDSHLFINQQWLDNLGLEVPTTIDEYTEVLRAFKAQDADGDGDPNNEIPLGGTYGSMVDGVNFMFPMWGIPWRSDKLLAINDEGQVYSPLQASGLRAALETISLWYQEGLLDVEAVSQDTNAFEAKVNAGNYGSFWRWRMTAMGTDESVSSQYVCILPPQVEGYQTTLPRYLEMPTFGAALTVTAERNGTVEAACRWLDTQLEWDNMINGYNGMKGEYWDYDANGMVDIFPMSDGTRTVPGQSSMYYSCGADYFARVNMPSHRIEKTSYCNMYTEAGFIETNSSHILTKLVTLTVEESQRAELLFAEIEKYAKEAVTGFIVKGVTDDSWSAYLSTLESLRLDEYVSIYQTVYDRYLQANE